MSAVRDTFAQPLHLAPWHVPQGISGHAVAVMLGTPSEVGTCTRGAAGHQTHANGVQAASVSQTVLDSHAGRQDSRRHGGTSDAISGSEAGKQGPWPRTRETGTSPRAPPWPGRSRCCTAGTAGPPSGRPPAFAATVLTSSTQGTSPQRRADTCRTWPLRAQPVRDSLQSCCRLKHAAIDTGQSKGGRVVLDCASCDDTGRLRACRPADQVFGGAGVRVLQLALPDALRMLRQHPKQLLARLRLVRCLRVRSATSCQRCVHFGTSSSRYTSQRMSWTDQAEDEPLCAALCI